MKKLRGPRKIKNEIKKAKKPYKIRLFGFDLHFHTRKMARLGGFEPSTYRFVAGHSIH